MKKLKLVFNLFLGGQNQVARLDGLSKTSSEKLIWVFQQLKSGVRGSKGDDGVLAFLRAAASRAFS